MRVSLAVYDRVRRHDAAGMDKEHFSGQGRMTSGVTIVTATNKPLFMQNLFTNFKRQQWRVKEMIVLLNNDGMNIELYKKQASSFGNVSIYKLPAKWSLGKCLNYGISKAQYEIIAKFDDDDYYAPNYLTEAMLRLEKTEADLIGKNKFYMYFKHSSRLMLATMPSKNRVAGATMLFKKKLYPDVSFKHLRKGTDMRFQKDSIKKGYKLAFTSPSHFVAIRRANQKMHTWKVTKKTIRLLRAKKIAQTKQYRSIVNQSSKQK
ncbi:glycosyltransferase family 2 protein [Paenibacillus sp. 2TAB26]|uniref:glycosyltransferase n=1 Tax=Paenibacillus sp. 2TAB26 TaxID=3233005 RepID=UPI003F9CD260